MIQPFQPLKTSKLTLRPLGLQSISIQAVLLIAAAWVLPALAHLSGVSVRMLLPMHWPVLLSGLVYGWRSGLLIGMLAPAVSFLISGMPVPAILPSMTLELALYGMLAGLCREVFRLGFFTSTMFALLGGRIVFLSVVLLTGATQLPFGRYLETAMLPGIAAAIGQLILLPIAARWWIHQEDNGQHTS